MSGGDSSCLNEGPHPTHRGDKSKNVKLYWKYFKNPLFKTTGPISTKFGTKNPWIDGIQIFTNKGPHPSSRGDNSKIIKIYGEYLKILYFRTTGSKIRKKHPWVEEIQIFLKSYARR